MASRMTADQLVCGDAQVDGPLDALLPGASSELGAQGPVDRDHGRGGLLQPVLEAGVVTVFHVDDVVQHDVWVVAGRPGRGDVEETASALQDGAQADGDDLLGGQDLHPHGSRRLRHERILLRRRVCALPLASPAARRRPRPRVDGWTAPRSGGVKASPSLRLTVGPIDTSGDRPTGWQCVRLGTRPPLETGKCGGVGPPHRHDCLPVAGAMAAALTITTIPLPRTQEVLR